MPTIRTAMTGPVGLGGGAPAMALRIAGHCDAAAIGKVITVPGCTP
jgi:hypothetical protein